MLAIDDTCAACEELRERPECHPHHPHTCGREQAERLGDVGRCVLKGKNVWAFPPGTIFMPKTAVPKALNRPGSRGDSLLRQDSVHFQKHHVYKTKDAKGDTVYYAHEGSL